VSDPNGSGMFWPYVGFAAALLLAVMVVVGLVIAL
jgi:hypothetical protein